jgi:mono/diheme cytochrome c family protein
MRPPRADPHAAGRRGLAFAIVLAAALAAFPALTAPPQLASPDHFAAGEGRAIAERACLICHSAMLVTQQAKDSTGWEKTLATMRKWGAPLSDAERDTLRTWLVVTLGPRPATP